MLFDQHLPAQPERDHHADQAHAKSPEGEHRPGQLFAGQQGEGGDRGHESGGNDGSGRGGGGLVDVVFQHPPVVRSKGSPHHPPEPKAEQRGGDGHIERPADFQTAVDIAWNQQSAQCHAGEDGAPGELGGRDAGNGIALDRVGHAPRIEDLPWRVKPGGVPRNGSGLLRGVVLGGSGRRQRAALGYGSNYIYPSIK